MPMTKTLTRRVALGSAGAAALAPFAASAQERIPASAQRQCATCEFWGGQRQVSADRQFVVATGRGLCSNPASPAYQRQTAPTQGAPVWARWRALG
jgi:hypothetical protein